MKPRATLGKFVVVAAVATAVLAAAPAPPTTAVQLDCPVLAVRIWCTPDCKSVGCDRYCSRLWVWDEYHFVVDIKAKALNNGSTVGAKNLAVTIQTVDTPHVGLTTPTTAAPKTINAPPPPITVNDAAIAWSGTNGGNETAFVLWRDTLGLDVTTIIGEASKNVTVLWRGTCVKTPRQLPTVTPTPKST